MHFTKITSCKHLLFQQMFPKSVGFLQEKRVQVNATHNPGKKKYFQLLTSSGRFSRAILLNFLGIVTDVWCAAMRKTDVCWTKKNLQRRMELLCKAISMNVCVRSAKQRELFIFCWAELVENVSYCFVIFFLVIFFHWDGLWFSFGAGTFHHNAWKACQIRAEQRSKLLRWIWWKKNVRTKHQRNNQTCEKMLSPETEGLP